MRILLTGAKGNFGREMLKQADMDVVQLNRDGWDDLDGKFAQNIDVVIHAASDLYTKASDSPHKLIDSNLLSTATLLEHSRKHRVRRMIFLSSCAVYGEVMRTSEESPCCPVSINGISKLLNERMVAEFCAANGIKCEILRIFNMYGGQDKFSIVSHLEQALETGEPFTLNNMGIAQRDFIHVADVTAVVLELLKLEIPYTYMNIGTGSSTRISTLVELVSKRFPAFKIRHANTREAEYSRADISKLRQFVKIEFMKIEEYMENHFRN